MEEKIISILIIIGTFAILFLFAYIFVREPRNEAKPRIIKESEYLKGKMSSTFRSLSPTKISFYTFLTFTEIETFNWHEYAYIYDFEMPIIVYKKYTTIDKYESYYYYFSYKDVIEYHKWIREKAEEQRKREEKEREKIQRKKDIKALSVLNSLLAEEIDKQREIQEQTLKENLEIEKRIIEERGI